MKFPDFIPAFYEKLNLYMSVQNWYEVLETGDRILAIKPNSTLALMVSENN